MSMEGDSHTEDLRNVREGDTLHIYTTEGENFSAECTNYEKQNADPRSGEVRETKIWSFDTPKGTLHASILDGLKSSEDGPDFPQHSGLYATSTETPMGYIGSLELRGQEA